MATNYPYYSTQQPYYTQPVRYVEQPQLQIKGRPVTSIEEVRAMTIDFDGSVFYFPDLANKRIYTKQINYDGTSTINIYELLQVANKSETQYVTRDECSVVKAMEEAEEEKQEQRGVDKYYYTEKYMPIPYQRVYERDMDRDYGRMYYEPAGSGTNGWSSSSDRSGGRTQSSRNSDSRSFYEPPYMMYDRSPMLRDPREGRSADRRRMYMESKELHQGKEKQLQELESYMTELSGDITDMIHGASPEERQMLQKKFSALASKIDQV